MSLPPGYLLPEGKSMQDILRMDAELLSSEGIDPQLPSFEEPLEGSEGRLGLSPTLKRAPLRRQTPFGSA